MNIYYLRIITGVSTLIDAEIKAKGVAWSESGLYEFWTIDDEGKRIGVAYYPVDRTIIESIEYNVEK